MRAAFVARWGLLLGVMGSSGCAAPTPTQSRSASLTPASRSQLREWLHDMEDAEVAPSAAVALEAEGARAVPGLVDLFERDERDVWRRASNVIVAIGEDALGELRGEIRVRPRRLHANRRDRVLQTLMRMGPTAAPLSPDLLALIRRTADELVARRVADTWVSIGSAALPEIREALTDASDAVASVGATASWRLGPPAVDPLVHEVTRGTSAAVRLRAARALATMLSTSSRVSGGLPLSDHNGYYKEYVSIEGQAVGEHVLEVLCPYALSQDTRPSAARRGIGLYGSPEIACASPAKRVALALALHDGNVSPDVLIRILQHDPDPVFRARVIRPLYAWASKAPGKTDTTALRGALLGALADDREIAREAANVLVSLFGNDLPPHGVEAVIEFHLGWSAPGHFPRIPRSVLETFGPPSFDLVLAVAGSGARPDHERIVALRTLRNTSLEKVAAGAGPGAEEAMTNRLEVVLTRVEGTGADAVRAEALDGLLSMHARRRTLAGFAGRLSRASEDGVPAVRAVAVRGLQRFLPDAHGTLVRGSIPELSHYEYGPPRAFSASDCSRAQGTPAESAPATQFATWATCLLITLRSDGDPGVAKRATDALATAKIDVRP